MTTPELVERFARLETQIAQEKGDFALFALFMREEVPDRWDLMVSASWAGGDDSATVDYRWRKSSRSWVTAIWSAFRESW